MEEIVQISKSDHALDLLAKFNEFRKTKKHCDFIIRVGDKEMPVHKFVVSASSEYFEAMLSHETIESNSGVVEMKEVDPDCVEKCVDFMYTGEASVSDEMQRDLMHVAHMMRLERLYNGVAAFLEKKLDISSFYSTREIAKLYGCENLLKTCNEYATNNFRAIAKLDDFKQLEVDYVKLLLSSDQFKESDAIKCKALMLWINYESSRAASLFDLMKAVDFRKISMPYRRFLIENEPAISNSTECWKIVMKSVFDDSNTKSCDVTMDYRPGIIVLDSGSSRLKRFNLVERTWTDMQVMHQNMINQQSSVIVEKEYMYVFTGNHMTYRLNFTEPDAKWEQMAARTGNMDATVILNGMIYSTDYCNYSNQIERYDTCNNNWTFIANRSASIIASAIAVFQESIYLIGGRTNANQTVVSVQIYHPTTSTWSTGPNLRQARYSASAVVWNEAIYVFGGYCSKYNNRCHNTYLQSVEILHHNATSWLITTLDNFKRQNFSCYAFEGRIYLVGNNNSNFKTIDEYDPNTQQLQTVASMDDKTMKMFSSAFVMI